MWLNLLSVALVVLFHFVLVCQGAPIENTIESSHRNKRSVYNIGDENPWIDYWDEDDDSTFYTTYPDDVYDTRRPFPNLLRLQYRLRDFLPTRAGLLDTYRKRGGAAQREYPTRGRTHPLPSRGGSHRPYNKCKRGRGGVGTWVYGC